MIRARQKKGSNGEKMCMCVCGGGVIVFLSFGGRGCLCKYYIDSDPASDRMDFRSKWEPNIAVQGVTV